jgi:hypothetical protein
MQKLTSGLWSWYVRTFIKPHLTWLTIDAVTSLYASLANLRGFIARYFKSSRIIMIAAQVGMVPIQPKNENKTQPANKRAPAAIGAPINHANTLLVAWSVSSADQFARRLFHEIAAIIGNITAPPTITQCEGRSNFMSPNNIMLISSREKPRKRRKIVHLSLLVSVAGNSAPSLFSGWFIIVKIDWGVRSACTHLAR